MRAVIAHLMITIAVFGVRLASARPEGDLSVTIQIHDYSRVPHESLSRATQLVTRLYETIGVRTEWIGVVRQGDGTVAASRGEEPRPPIGQLTILVLTPKMAARGRVADGVLGFAAVANDRMGRIAYVIYDRVRSIAAQASTHEAQLLAFVMAHEIGHLLQPGGPQPSTGFMKDCWTTHDLRGMDVGNLGFSLPQASHIRRTIENEGATAGSVAHDPRAVTPRDGGGVAQDHRESAPERRHAPPRPGVNSGCRPQGSH